MPGTVPSPVRLDPFRRIVGIHWGESDPDLALAFAVAIRVTLYTESLGGTDIAAAARYRNPFDWLLTPPAPIPPLYWTPRLLFEDGWENAILGVVTGLQPHGAPPGYYWPSLETFDGTTYEGLRWHNPTGGSLGFTVPINSLGETSPREFLAGAATIVDYEVGGSPIGERMAYPGGDDVSIGGRTFSYAGARAIQNPTVGHPVALIGGPDGPAATVDYELWQVYLPVTA